MKRAAKPPAGGQALRTNNKALVSSAPATVTMCSEAAAILRSELELEAALRSQLVFVHRAVADEMFHHRLSDTTHDMAHDDIAWIRIAKAAGATDQTLFGLTVGTRTVGELTLQ